MVLRTAPSSPAMATSDQPVKKKLRIHAPDIEDGSDRSTEDIFESDSPPTERALEYPPRPGDSPDSGTVSEDAVDCSALLIHPRNLNIDYLLCDNASSSNGEHRTQSGEQSEEDFFESDLKVLQNGLVKQCLCHVETTALIRPFNRRLKIATWPVNRTLEFLSTTQLLFDVYLKQNNTGTICSRIMHACDTLVRNQYDWVTEIVELSDNKSKFVVFVASKVLSSFLVVAKDTIDQNWIQQIAENVYLFDTFNRITVQKINFSLDIIKRIVEWKNFEQHPLEDSNYINTANHVDEDNPFRSQTGYASQSTSNVPSTSGNSEVLQNAFSNLNTHSTASTSTENNDKQFKLQDPVLKFPMEQPDVHECETPQSEESNETPVGRLERVTEHGCVTVVLTDSESFDTSHIKCLTIKTLQHHWSALVKNIKLILVRYLNLSNAENCILTFFTLWENIISVKTNLSVIDTKPFYADLQSFVDLLRSTNLPHLIYKQLLSLFNEVLCYGSTLALQDILPEEICTVAHAIVRYVKDFRLLSEIQITNSRSGFNFIGSESPLVRNYSLGAEVSNGVSLVDRSYDDDDDDYESTERPERNEIDKTMLQKMSLLVLKSVAVTVKEMRCDSSDSSIDSSDYNAIQDMQIVERSIRDVLKKIDIFIKNSLEFHPETPFTKMLVHLFSEQDDYLIESMVCTLDITVGIVYRNSVYPDLITMLNPIVTFIEFLKVVSHDSDVLLDYLVSNETCFLLYLLRFLKYVRRNWSKFLESCQASDMGNGTRGLDDTMSVLIRLRLQISRLVSKSLFPYNISPVLRLLEVCESLYEGNELS